MSDFAYVCIVGLASIVAIVAIYFGRAIKGKVNGDSVEVAIEKQDFWHE